MYLNDKRKIRLHMKEAGFLRLYTKCWGEERAYKINLKNFQKK